MVEKRRTAKLFLAGLTAAAVFLCLLLFRPYLTPILFACVIAIVFYPLYRHTQKVLHSPTGSALVSTLATILLIVVPLTFVLLAFSKELTDLYQSVGAKSAESGGVVPYLLQAPEKLMVWASRHFSTPAIDLRKILASRVESISSSLIHFSGSLVSNLASLLANAVIALIVLFFLFRDGDRLLSAIMEILPMDRERISELRTRISSSITANFYGSFAVGALQGTLTGLSFWVLGLDAPVLWGVVAAVFSLVPLVGSAAVWLPAAIILLFTGHLVKGLILLGVGAGVISTVDNIVRPLIVHKSVPVHPILILFSILGGVKVFGVLGLFVGPVIVSVTAALLGMLRQDLVSETEREPGLKLVSESGGPATRKPQSLP